MIRKFRHALLSRHVPYLRGRNPSRLYFPPGRAQKLSIRRKGHLKYVTGESVWNCRDQTTGLRFGKHESSVGETDRQYVAVRRQHDLRIGLGHEAPWNR